jgi:HEPN domain-containing protein
MNAVERMADLFRRAQRTWVSELRTKRAGGKLVQAEVSSGIQRSVRQVRNIEKATSALTPSTLAAICYQYDLSLVEGLEGLARTVKRLGDDDPEASGPRETYPPNPHGDVITDATEGGSAPRGGPTREWRKGWAVLKKDLECAELCLRGEFYEAAVFHGNFAATVAVLAAVGWSGEGVPEERALTTLLSRSDSGVDVRQEVLSAARRLDSSYAPVHYHSTALPVQPSLVDQRMAHDALEDARVILEFCENRLLEQERQKSP